MTFSSKFCLKKNGDSDGLKLDVTHLPEVVAFLPTGQKSPPTPIFLASLFFFRFSLSHEAIVTNVFEA